MQKYRVDKDVEFLIDVVWIPCLDWIMCQGIYIR
jgi:hypothetical protein